MLLTVSGEAEADDDDDVADRDNTSVLTSPFSIWTHSSSLERLFDMAGAPMTGVLLSEMVALGRDRLGGSVLTILSRTVRVSQASRNNLTLPRLGWGDDAMRLLGCRSFCWGVVVVVVVLLSDDGALAVDGAATATGTCLEVTAGETTLGLGKGDTLVRIGGLIDFAFTEGDGAILRMGGVDTGICEV